ncbi:MAG: hypothetical protein CVV27_02110 [Candidatus Melainabacteria bacterium HGW-Melainabacteria-1]|nr:MAG: hypothetical protein CVV27_02110 [Candidatus Melainabacteria bacterium HGW-Melainabacteria-1]
MLKMIKQLPRLASAALLCLVLVACPQSASLEAPGAENGTGPVNDFNIESNVRVALFEKSQAEGDKVPELTYGAMDAHFVTIDQIAYMVDWNDLEDFKNLKTGEKISFRATGYIARLEKNGNNFRVIRLNEM